MRRPRIALLLGTCVKGYGIDIGRDKFFHHLPEIDSARTPTQTYLGRYRDAGRGLDAPDYLPAFGRIFHKGGTGSVTNDLRNGASHVYVEEIYTRIDPQGFRGRFGQIIRVIAE